MRIRQETGEVAPWAWLGGAFGATTVASSAFFAYPWIGMLAALILTGAFGLIAVLCFLAAGKQRYINVGRAQVLAESAPTMPIDPRHSLSAPSPPKKKPARIELVDTESDANLSIFDDGVVRWSPSRGPGHFIERGLVVVFRHVGGRDVAVNAHLIFVNRASVAKVRVYYGTWLGAAIRTALFSAGDTHELVAATLNRTIPACSTFEDAREQAGEGNITVKHLPDGRYALKVDLDVIDEYSGEVTPESFNFDVVLDALNPHSCSISRA